MDVSYPNSARLDGAEERLRGCLQVAERVDLALCAAFARTSTPILGHRDRRLAQPADYLRLCVTCAAALAVTGGR